MVLIIQGGIGMSIKTYHEMNEVIKDLLSRSDEQFDEYVLTRIIELEQQNEELAVAYNNAQKEIVILKNKVNNKNEV